MEGCGKQRNINQVVSAYDHSGQLANESSMQCASPKAPFDKTSVTGNSKNRGQCHARSLGGERFD
jgi:hypothetical protein